MNEVEKMYSNAGLSNMWVERYDDKEIWHKSYSEMINTVMKLNDWTRQVAIDVAKKECKKEFPPFTAKKQLELIKWMALTRPVTINKFIDGWNIEGSVRNNKQYANFENAISGYINSIYPFLDERQRAEIKEILE